MATDSDGTGAGPLPEIRVTANVDIPGEILATALPRSPALRRAGETSPRSAALDSGLPRLPRG